jgi:hypothetical protein
MFMPTGALVEVHTASGCSVAMDTEPRIDIDDDSRNKNMLSEDDADDDDDAGSNAPDEAPSVPRADGARDGMVALICKRRGRAVRLEFLDRGLVQGVAEGYWASEMS